MGIGLFSRTDTAGTRRRGTMDPSIEALVEQVRRQAVLHGTDWVRQQLAHPPLSPSSPRPQRAHRRPPARLSPGRPSPPRARRRRESPSPPPRGASSRARRGTARTRLPGSPQPPPPSPGHDSPGPQTSAPPPTAAAPPPSGQAPTRPRASTTTGPPLTPPPSGQDSAPMHPPPPPPPATRRGARRRRSQSDAAPSPRGRPGRARRRTTDVPEAQVAGDGRAQQASAYTGGVLQQQAAGSGHPALSGQPAVQGGLAGPGYAGQSGGLVNFGSPGLLGIAGSAADPGLGFVPQGSFLRSSPRPGWDGGVASVLLPFQVPPGVQCGGTGLRAESSGQGSDGRGPSAVAASAEMAVPPVFLSGVSPGVTSTTRRTGIPTPRDLPTPIARTNLRPPTTTSTKKTLPSPTSPNASIPAKSIRTSPKPKHENESGNPSVFESQVKELLAEAKTKDFEISKLRSELQKCKDQECPSPDVQVFQDALTEIQLTEGTDPEVLLKTLHSKNLFLLKELALLRQENEDLKQKLDSLEQSPLSDTISSNGTDSSIISPSTQATSTGNKMKGSLTQEPGNNQFLAGGHGLPISGSSSSDVTKASISPDSDFEHLADVPSRPGSSGSIPCQGSKCSTSGSSPNNISDLSVASLTEKIHKMEENQHSTAEELQATLQELSDQNLMVQELTLESEKLGEEKAFLETALQQQRQRADQLSQENEKLMALLQDKAKTEESQVQSKLTEVEKKYAELVEKSQFEREKLLNIQQQLTSSLRNLEKEHQEAQVTIKRLTEEIGKLQGLQETERKEKNGLAKTVEDLKVTIEGLKIEGSCLKSQLDGERQKVVEITAMGNTPENCEVQEMLSSSHKEKEHLELTCSELRQELLRANSEVKQLQCLLAKVETECHDLKQLGDQREEKLKCANLKLQEKSSEKDTEIKDMKDTIFELEDQVEQHRAVKLHNNQLICDLENKVDKMEEQKQDLERQLKVLNKQMKEDAEEWKKFQADLQTAVVVANDIKCEAQQELRAVKRRLLEEEERNARLHRELEDVESSRKVLGEDDPMDGDSSIQWQGLGLSQVSSSSNDLPATVKSLIKSFDTAPQGGGTPSSPAPSTPRSPLSGIPVRTTPALAVLPMQRHSASSPLKLSSKDTEKQLDFTDKVKGQRDEMTPDRFPRKSPSLESLNTTLSFGSRTSSPFALDPVSPQSKLSVERKDHLAALAREYGGSKRNALLKWCQKKTEGYSNIDITNFSSSWSDGLAFCALLHTYLPAHIPYHELNSQDKKRNLKLAFQAAESIGIKASLDLNELMFTDRPDWQSVMNYVSQIYKYFET